VKRAAFAVGIRGEELWRTRPVDLQIMLDAFAEMNGAKPENKPPADIKAALASITRKADG
jgi:hypothetical protein